MNAHSFSILAAAILLLGGTACVKMDDIPSPGKPGGSPAGKKLSFDVTVTRDGKAIPTGAITKGGVDSGDKIAIELTESRSESDFILMKEKIEELKDRGIKFYLDDFGTGYSNMERIMELPFDIIKFDRSLLLASGTDDRSKKMVSNLANMFADMNYYVLYEGVEKDSDEDMCKRMSAAYLQGFKYSKPAPIVELKDYISRRSG